MKPIAIIPARGGSKRIPKKNIVDFHGKPLIARTIEAALRSECFAHVFVSTDSTEIAEVAQTWGAEVPFLRRACADDHSTASEATRWTVDEIAKTMSFTPDHVVQMMANVPFKTADTIRRFTEELVEDQKRSLITCFEPKFSPPHWAIEEKTDGTGQFVFKQFLNRRSQDLPRFLIPSGALWGATWDYLQRHNSFYGLDFRIFEISWLEALDMDTPEELEICRALAQAHSR